MASVYLYPMRTSTFIFPFSIFSFVNKSTIYTYIQHSPKGNIPLAQIYAVDMRYLLRSRLEPLVQNSQELSLIMRVICSITNRLFPEFVTHK